MKRLFISPIIVSWFINILGLANFLLVVPFALKYLTEAEFASWLFLSSVFAGGLIIETTAIVVSTRLLSYLHSGKTILNNLGKKITADYTFYDAAHSLFFAYLLLAVVAFVLSLMLGLFFGDNLRFSLEAPDDFLYALLIMSLGLVFLVVSSLWKAMIIAQGRILHQRYIQLVTYFYRILTTIYVVIEYNNLISIFIILASAQFLEASLYKMLIKRNEVNKLNVQILKNMLSPFSRTLIIKIGAYLVAFSSSLIVAQLDVESATKLLLSFRLLQALSSVSITPLSVKIPELNKLRIDKTSNITWLTEVSRLTALSIVVYLIGSFILYFFGNNVLSLFREGNVDVLLDSELLAFLIIIGLLDLHQNIHATIYQTTNNIPFVAIYTITGCCILILDMIVVNKYEIFGLLVVQFFVQLIGVSWYPVYLNLKSINASFSEYMRSLFYTIYKFEFLKII